MLHNSLCKCDSDLSDHMHHRYETLPANDLPGEIKRRTHMKHAGAWFLTAHKQSQVSALKC